MQISHPVAHFVFARFLAPPAKMISPKQRYPALSQYVIRRCTSAYERLTKPLTAAWNARNAAEITEPRSPFGPVASTPTPLTFPHKTAPRQTLFEILLNELRELTYDQR